MAAQQLIYIALVIVMVDNRMMSLLPRYLLWGTRRIEHGALSWKVSSDLLHCGLKLLL